MLRTTRLVSPLFLTLVLAGCATTGPVEAPGPGRAADPADLTQWTAKGRLALTTQQGEGGSGSFVWQQRSERTEISVRGPLGAGGLNVVTDGTTLQVHDGSGEPIDGEDARRLLEQRLGTSLPLDELRYWMLGLPAPGIGADRLGEDGAAAMGFTQVGWQVTYEEFRTAGGWALPTRLSAATAAARVRIVVDDWQIPGS